MSNIKQEKEIAYKDNVITSENLPLPIVYYPGFYGAFFCFSSVRESKKYFCSCAYEAIANYITLKIKGNSYLSINPNRNFILDSMYFPLSLVNELMNEKVPQNEKIIEYLSFKNKICHECNKRIPSKKYCHPMYGASFKQNYGWYINKQGLEWGIMPISNKLLKEKCPQEILELLVLDPDEIHIKWEKLIQSDPAKARQIIKPLIKQNKQMWRIAENEVRMKFGHRKIGEAWTSETILYHIVKSLLPNMTVLRHFRPEFLEGLELDIFVKEINIGIEYQGIQHYQPVKHWGGIEALERLKDRDSKKRKIMEKNNLPLIYFYYNEDLNDEFVYSKIKKYVK